MLKRGSSAQSPCSMTISALMLRIHEYMSPNSVSSLAGSNAARPACADASQRAVNMVQNCGRPIHCGGLDHPRDVGLVEQRLDLGKTTINTRSDRRAGSEARHVGLDFAANGFRVFPRFATVVRVSTSCSAPARSAAKNDDPDFAGKFAPVAQWLELVKAMIPTPGPKPNADSTKIQRSAAPRCHSASPKPLSVRHARLAFAAIPC